VVAARVKGCRVVGRGLLVDPAGRLLVTPQIHGFPGAGHPLYEALLWTWLELDEPRPEGAVARRELDSLAPRPLPGAHVLLAQPGHRVFGHWLLEVMPRLVMARRLGLGQLPLLLPHPLPSFATTCLALLGIDPGQLVLYDLHREAPAPETLYVVPSLSYGSHFAPLGRAVFDEIAAAAGPAPQGAGRRLYLSRAGLRAGMRHVNRAELRPLLERQGFEEICPETLPLAQQIALLRAASHVVAEDGSAAHLMAFAPAGLRALVLAAGTRTLFLHAALAQLRAQRIGFLIGEPLPSRIDSHVDHRVDPVLLEQALALLLSVT
jgi:capsular polysaccharide biosynthesis protein